MLISDIDYLEVVDKKDPVYGGDVMVATASTVGIGIATEGEPLQVNSYAYGSGDLGSQHQYQSFDFWGFYQSQSQYGPDLYASANSYAST